MAKIEWIKSIVLILVGIILGSLLSQNSSIQDFLFQHFPDRWRSVMGLVILLVVLIALLVWYWRLEVKQSNTLDAKLDAIINKLGIAQEDIDKIRGHKKLKKNDN